MQKTCVAVPLFWTTAFTLPCIVDQTRAYHKDFLAAGRMLLQSRMNMQSRPCHLWSIHLMAALPKSLRKTGEWIASLLWEVMFRICSGMDVLQFHGGFLNA
mmetsp:Transcript_7720/g.16965  ORF Transcript_7720/g.16965 Transcript_7720/m.16965 type:complete len:101 (-) Transcript_7720:55-357(-)